MIHSTAILKQTDIESAVEKAQQWAGPDVVRIRYELGEDWSGEASIFFRVVLTDDAAKRRLREVANKIKAGLAREIDFESFGLIAYHNFRSESEQAKLREPAWG